MHNLFLGITKHAIKTWRDLNIITYSDLEVLQDKVDSMNPPPRLGRIPRKIGSNFSSITADEWKYWILVYSSYCLYGILPPDHYSCWCLYVNACKRMQTTYFAVIRGKPNFKGI